MKVSFVEDIKYVWKYSTAVIAYLATVFGGFWVTLTEQQRLDFLGLFGITPSMFAGFSVIGLAIAFLTARSTKIEFKPPVRDEE